MIENMTRTSAFAGKAGRPRHRGQHDCCVHDRQRIVRRVAERPQRRDARRKGIELRRRARCRSSSGGPPGASEGGVDCDELAAHIDVAPTILELADIDPGEHRLDGASLVPVLRQETRSDFPRDRVHFIQHQQVRRDGEYKMESPRPFFHSAVLTDRWRLVGGEELYDIDADPGQSVDVSDKHPDVVARLRNAYQAWWNDVTRRFDEFLEIPVGL